MYQPAGNIENFKARSLDNFSNRTLHHHIFDIKLITKILRYVGLDVIETSKSKN